MAVLAQLNITCRCSTSPVGPQQYNAELLSRLPGLEAAAEGIQFKPHLERLHNICEGTEMGEDAFWSSASR